MKFERKVANFIKRNQLLVARSTVLVAFSGGADSVALLRILLQLGYVCCVAHCNFKLRGAESDRDESFVRSVCGQLSVPCRVATFDTRNYAQENKLSIEMAARELRYGFFYQLLDELKMDVVAVAHHSSDQAETVLLNLLRGSGLQGLRGMKPQHDRIVRPLLCCSKTEILQYLEELKQPFVTDSSNLTDEPLRNKIRLHVLPMLEKINPRAEAAVCRSASYLSQAEELLNKSVTEEFNIYKAGENACRRQILETPFGEFILHKWLSNYGFNYSQLEQIVNSSLADGIGKRFESPSHILWIDRELLICQEKDVENEFPELLMESFSAHEINLSAESNVAFLDADALALPLKQRRFVPGDRFVPLGMKGSKLVSDFLTDCKCSPLEKQQQTVLIDAKGRIVWLVGKRIDNRFKLTKQTKNIIKISLQ